MNLSPHDLRQLLRYDPESGKLFWLPRASVHFEGGKRHTPEFMAARWNKQFAGKEAFTSSTPSGHKQGMIFHRRYVAHRIAWAIFYGAWPEQLIDHIDRNPANNRISNLRDVPPHINSRNNPIRACNTSGYPGVGWRRCDQRWVARIRMFDRQTQIGSFKTREEAIDARKAFEAVHGFLPATAKVVA